uniref:uncharacterized protein LOC120328443 isoform X2 n=1 Tax=Styela clava TaxID=7725 RepID=UPI0019393A87|nr:uncharacterized protein LOC120328443 isoform X2 [Styela clava]
MMIRFHQYTILMSVLTLSRSQQNPPVNTEHLGPPWGATAPGEGEEDTGGIPPRGPPQRRRPYHDIEFPTIKYHHQPPYDYANAIAKSMLFYEAQRSGELPYDHRIPWRGDSALNDGADVGYDLTGGYYDGGGYIKYGFPMAYTTTILSWGIIRYRRTYEAIGQLDHALKTIRWATDYFLKCSVGPTEFYGQVSDQSSDMRYIGTPERMNYKRKSYVLTETKPGSDLIGETAAALAAASIVFYETDRAYSDVLIKNAKELYDFAGGYRGKYHDYIKPAEAAYRSHSGYKDELAWAAAWIYRRTGDNAFLREAKRIYKSAKLNSQAIMFSWDDKKVGVQMLLAEMTKKEIYKTQVRAFCQWCLPGGKSTHTQMGLLFVAEWGPLRYAANAAFICSLAAEMGINSEQYRLFALKQIGYILGSTGRSYVVGFGENSPTKYFHEGSYCPSPPAPCPAFSANFDNAHVLYGALVGGPSEADTFYNSIEKREQSSVAMDYNAGYQSALAAVLDIHVFGLHNRPKLDKPGRISTANDTMDEEEDSEEKEGDGEIVYDYPKALYNSILFYEAQRSGYLEVDRRIPWRSDSAVYDGTAIMQDLVGGYYDGGDYVKYTFPLAFTITTLSWGAIEYSDAYNTTGRLFDVLGGIKWGTDYLMKCHISETTIVSQVGDQYFETMTWDRPEYINDTTKRPVQTITDKTPGADVVSEMAAAFAAVSLAFEDLIDSDYRKQLLDRAKLLYSFADTYEGIYTKFQPNSISTYNSTGYHDELAWAAMWIYKATGDTQYLNSAKTIYNNHLLKTPKTFSYDDKTAALHLFMAEQTQDPEQLVKFCNWVVNKAKKTPKGLFYQMSPPTKHAANVAFILLLASEKFEGHPDSSSWKFFARDQINYILGSSGQGYQVGYGDNFPQQPYHKASSCPRVPLPCGFSYMKTGTPNQQLLVGAVVAGPDSKDVYVDKRMQRKHTAVSLDTNAGFQSSVAGLIHLQRKGLLGNSASTVTFFLNRLSFPITFLLSVIWFNVVIYISNSS